MLLGSLLLLLLLLLLLCASFAKFGDGSWIAGKLGWFVHSKLGKLVYF